MKKIIAVIKKYRWGILSGILIGTSWIPLPPWALFFSFVPLWTFMAREAKTWKEVFWAAWWTQFLLSLIGFYWIAFVSHEYGFMPWPAAVLVALIFAVFMHIYVAFAPALAFYLAKRFELRTGALLLLAACLMSLFEIYWPSIFPWNMAYPLMPSNTPLVQWADTFGFLGLSLGVLLCNALLTYLWLKKNAVQAAMAGAISLLLFAGLYWGGIQKRNYWSETDAEIKVLQVQANIGNAEKYYAERGQGFENYIADEFFNLTKQGLEKYPDSDLVIWPETAITEYLNPHMMYRQLTQRFVSFVKEIKKPILTGAYSKDGPEVRGKKKEYNALFLFDADGKLTQAPYHKTYLLIFGEYIPYGDKYEWLAKLNPGGAGFGTGSGPTVFNYAGTQIGLQICYESLYPEFSAKLDELGAKILFNVTNDSWFGPTSEPFQHMYMTLARGLEVRRPMIRTTNTGISTAMLADGEVFELGPIYEKWYGQRVISYKSQPARTFYSKFGHWLPLAVFLMAVLTCLLGRNRKKTS